MIPLRNVPFPFLPLESTKSFPWIAESVQGMMIIQLVAASGYELRAALLIHSCGVATILDIALLLSLD